MEKDNNFVEGKIEGLNFCCETLAHALQKAEGKKELELKYIMAKTIELLLRELDKMVLPSEEENK